MNLLKTDLLTRSELSVVNDLLLDLAIVIRRTSPPLVERLSSSSITCASIMNYLSSVKPQITQKIEVVSLCNVFDRYDEAVVKKLCDAWSKH
jgi:hypothetical protein